MSTNTKSNIYCQCEHKTVSDIDRQNNDQPSCKHQPKQQSTAVTAVAIPKNMVVMEGVWWKQWHWGQCKKYFGKDVVNVNLGDDHCHCYAGLDSGCSGHSDMASTEFIAVIQTMEHSPMRPCNNQSVIEVQHYNIGTPQSQHPHEPTGSLHHSLEKEATKSLVPQIYLKAQYKLKPINQRQPTSFKKKAVYI